MVKVQRAWNGNISRIDNFMSWLYENSLTKTEQDQKDRLFRKYYRFYNDGDIPRGMKYKLNCNVKHQLEVQVNEFISKMLKKYMTTNTRRQYRTDKLNTNLRNTNALGTGTNRIPGMLNYHAAQQFAKQYNIPELQQVNDQIEQTRKQLAQLEAEAGRLIVDEYMQNHYRTSDKSLDGSIDIYNRFQR